MSSKVSGMNSVVLVLVAFSSLLSMFALTRIDSVVHGDLYRYGLRFSYGWAMPYWTMTTLIFTLGWFNIIIACAFQFYVLKYGQKKAEVIPQREALRPETTYHPPIVERPVEPEPQEMKPQETQEAIAPPMEVELGMREEAREAVEEIPPQEYIETESKPQEESEGSWPTETVETEPEEPAVQPMETEEREKPFEETEVPSAYEEAQEVEGQREQEAEPTETVEAEPTTEEKYEEPQEPVDVQFQEETSYVEEEETAETETQDTTPPAPEIEAEATEGEETQTQTLVSAEEQ